jgi:hypothetical protein
MLYPYFGRGRWNTFEGGSYIWNAAACSCCDGYKGTFARKLRIFALADKLDFAFSVEWPRFTSFLEKVSNCNGLLAEKNKMYRVLSDFAGCYSAL